MGFQVSNKALSKLDQFRCRYKEFERFLLETCDSPATDKFLPKINDIEEALKTKNMAPCSSTNEILMRLETKTGLERNESLA